MTSTHARLVPLLVTQLGVAAEQCHPEALLVPHHDEQGRQLESHRDHLGCDSLDVVELVMACEEEWGIEIPDDMAEPLNTGTVADLCAVIDKQQAQRAA
jgi:acyl carrier protein